MNPKKLNTLHLLNLDTVGGVERSFAAFLQDSRVHQAQRNHVLIGAKRIHPFFQEAIHQHAETVSYQRFWNQIRLPSYPGFIRRGHLLRTLKNIAPDRIVLWNCFGKPDLANVCAAASSELFYFERGSCWQHHPGRKTEEFLSKIDGILCNSEASSQVLKKRFGWSGPTERCLNSLQEDITPKTAQQKKFPSTRPLRLGIAGRIRSFKGHPVALHALKKLQEQNIDTELHIAGDGPLRTKMEDLAGQLGIQEKVHFLGVIQDMPSFYRDIDLLLVPSLREPFGLVSIEAAAWGCPVIASTVDGLPETMHPEQTGVSIPCSRPVQEYPQIGGTLSGLPELVYDPTTQEMRPLAFIDPGDLAHEIKKFCNQPQRFEEMSRRASINAIENFTFSSYITRLLEAFDRLSG